MRYENDPRICAHCRWLFSRDFPDGQMNQCRRNAPIVTGVLDSPISPVWPMVALNDYCGDFAEEEPRF